MPEEETLSAIIRQGSFGVPLLLEKRITAKLEGLDSGVLRFLCDDPDEFRPGEFASAAPGFYIDESEREKDASSYEFTLAVTGVDGNKPERRRKGFPEITTNLQDWDTAQDSWVTTNKDLITEGKIGTFGGNTVCLTATSRLIHPGWYEVTGSFSGIIRAKPRQRTITVNGETVSPEEPIRVSLPGGWNTPTKSILQLPKIVLQDRYFGFTAPPTNLLPGPLTPPGAPPVKLLSFTNVDLTRRWPGGWHLASIGGEQLGDRSLHCVVWTYEYQFPSTP